MKKSLVLSIKGALLLNLNFVLEFKKLSRLHFAVNKTKVFRIFYSGPHILVLLWKSQKKTYQKFEISL